uniref:UPAR/Ly6 domain-containing protein n=1 Tax=Schistosoma mansoni TaxID=6183 RepID=A0A3Q0KS58_SCHMA
MKYTPQILLVILLIVVNLDYSTSLSCYTCETCPAIFNASSPQVGNQSGCAWCVKIIVKYRRTPIRKCSDRCDYYYFWKSYSKFSYYCCNTDYCNKSIQNSAIHHILIMIIITLVCFYISRK